MVCKLLQKGPQEALVVAGLSPNSRDILTWCLGPVTVVDPIVLSGSVIRDFGSTSLAMTRVMLAHDVCLSSWRCWGSKRATGRAGPRGDLGDAAARDDFRKVPLWLATQISNYIHTHSHLSLNDRAS